MTLCLSNYGDKCCQLYVLMFGLWLFSRFTPPLTITAELSQSRMNLVHVSKRSVMTISVGGHTYCPASFQRLSAVVKGGKQDCVYSRKLCAAVYLWRGAVHAAKSVGLCIVVVVSPPEEIECGHSGRVVVLANHRYDSSSAHLCTRL